jgi:hypothetical protein
MALSPEGQVFKMDTKWDTTAWKSMMGKGIKRKLAFYH